MQEGRFDHVVCCEGVDDVGNTQASPLCNPIQHTPRPVPQITKISARCTLDWAHLNLLTSASAPRYNDSAQHVQSTAQVPSSAQSNELHGIADSSTALEIVFSTSIPSAVAYLLVAPARSWTEQRNSTSLTNAVQEAKFSAADVFSGTQPDEYSTTSSVEVVQAGSSYTRLRGASSGIAHASVKLISCLVDATSPLAVLVAASIPSRGYSKVHVHALNLPDDCMEDSSDKLVETLEGKYRRETLLSPIEQSAWIFTMCTSTVLNHLYYVPRGSWMAYRVDSLSCNTSDS